MIFPCESVLDSISGFTEQGGFLDRCKSFLRSSDSEQLWGIPRSQSTLEYSELAAILECRSIHENSMPIWELHLGKFPVSLEFQSWKGNFKTEVCANSVLLQITMHWTKEVEKAKSTDDLMTSQSITGRKDFTDYEMPDAKVASALEKILTSVHFRRRVSVEEQRAHKDYRFLRGRQFAFMIYEYFRATRAYAVVQGLSDPFKIRRQDDDVQDFDTRWDQSLREGSETHTETGLED